MLFENRIACPFEYWTNGCHFVFSSTGLVVGSVVQYSDVFTVARCAIALNGYAYFALSHDIKTNYNLNFLCSNFLYNVILNLNYCTNSPLLRRNNWLYR